MPPVPADMAAPVTASITRSRPPTVDPRTLPAPVSNARTATPRTIATAELLATARSPGARSISTSTPAGCNSLPATAAALEGSAAWAASSTTATAARIPLRELNEVISECWG